MKQFSYVINDIQKNKRVNIFYLIQITVAILLMSISISSAISFCSGYKSISSLRKSTAYCIQDKTGDEQMQEIFNNQNENVKKMRELYYIAKESNLNGFYTKFSYIMPEMVDGVNVEQLTANFEFMRTFNLNVIQGKSFSEKDFKTSSEFIPIICGYNLRNTYKLGQTYHFTSTSTGETINCKVIGILENNVGYYEMYNLKEKISLNYSIIQPLIEDTIDSMTFSDLDMLFLSSVFFTETPEQLNEISKFVYENGLPSYDIVPINSKLEDFVDDLKDELSYQIGIALIILLFAGIGMSANMSEMISKNMYEYSIHILCGARYIDICKRLIIQLLVVTLVAFIIILLIQGYNVSLLYTLILMIIISFIIMINPIISLYRIPISIMLRRKD